jgi:alpha-glucosidase
LRITSAEASAVRFRSRHVVGEVAVLANNLLRFRLGLAPALSKRPSWAVVKNEWKAPPCRVDAGPKRLRLATASGEFRLDLRTGGWQVRDAAGLDIFTAPPRTCGFAGASPRFALELVDRESLLGLGETTGPLNKRGLIRELWNIDVLGHASGIHPGLRSLYVSIPFLISLRDGRAAGIFWDNSARQVWDLGVTRPDRLAVTADRGELDLYLLLGPTLPDVVGRFTELTGRMPLPPRWALGYHQCRYSYESRRRLEQVAREFRRRQLPCDALYLDIHHLDGHRVFTFGRSFPRPAAMLRRLARQGFRVVTIVDPGVKDEPRFGVLRRGRALDAFVRSPDGKEDFIGETWPGRSRFPDFLSARVRAWWGREQARLQRLGVAGFWNDMNEPANFARPDRTLDPACRHRTDFGPARHAEVHNVYGSAMAQASRVGALAARPEERPFVVTRAGYAGVQRHAVVWTGDNSSCWEHLTGSIPLLLNLSLSGVALCGSDVGGFLDDCTGELLARWMQLGAFMPFFRNHSSLGTHAQEPWAFGPEIEAICRRYLEMRYQLLPYLYGRCVEAHREGTPIIRPLAWAHRNDPVAVACGDAFLFGADLLVAPVVQPGAVARSVYLPAGNWFNVWTGKRHYGRQHVVVEADLATLPLFARAGALLPMIEVQQFTGARRCETVNLHVWPGGPGALNWFEDDGWSRAAERGGIHERRITFRSRARGGELHFMAGQGGFTSEVKTWRVIVRAAHRRFRVAVGAERRTGQFVPEAGIFVFEFPNQSGEILARWW